MEIIIILACIALLYLLTHTFRIWLCKRRLLNHQFVIPLSAAFPANAPLIRAMVDELAGILDISTPEVFVYRARISNAFVTAMALRAELYIADEAFESANEHENPLKSLASLIAHELAHIKLNHSLEHAVWLYLSSISLLTNKAFQALQRIEEEADCLADQVCRRYFSTVNITRSSIDGQ